MYNANIPSDRELPSTGKLIKSTIFAAITACLLLVTVVMPAEYGIDPTGIGNAIGLKRMGEIKMSLAAEAAAEQKAAQVAVSTESTPIPPVAEITPVVAPTPVPAVQTAAAEEPQAAMRMDEMQVTLVPDEGTEIKVALSKGERVEYSWSTDGGKANFDVHGDSKMLNIDYHNYEKGSEQTKQGEIVAAFDGTHGWFWRNRTKETITVTLKVQGAHSDIKHMK
ncbi:MAG: transmembrane anchor protein [Alphaproteobacteria bacterium]|nr:transmembrane anchor protein [Alphaproteobacteria bacterium]